jgi:arginine exporter protein ArgO
MTALVPDTLQGAIIVSIIDFFLSFIIISGIGVVLACFPLLNRAALLFKAAPKAAHGKKATHAAQTHTAQPAPAEKKADAETLDNIAAIAAAVFVVMDGAPHHILSIKPSPRSVSWTAEGRIAQHGSHTVR